MNICVYGASSNSIDPEFLETGNRLGKMLAQNGYDLVFGGGATGMMGAVSKGILEENGKATGVAPEFFDEQEGILEKNCTEFIFTKTMRERKQIMDDLADGFIMTAGGIGTYEEYFEILTLKQLKQSAKPLVVLNTLGYFDDLYNLLYDTYKKNFMPESVLDLFYVADTPEDALRYLNEKLK